MASSTGSEWRNDKRQLRNKTIACYLCAANRPCPGRSKRCPRRCVFYSQGIIKSALCKVSPPYRGHFYIIFKKNKNVKKLDFHRFLKMAFSELTPQLTPRDFSLSHFLFKKLKTSADSPDSLQRYWDQDRTERSTSSPPWWCQNPDLSRNSALD